MSDLIRHDFLHKFKSNFDLPKFVVSFWEIGPGSFILNFVNKSL